MAGGVDVEEDDFFGGEFTGDGATGAEVEAEVAVALAVDQGGEEAGAGGGEEVG